MSVRFRDSFDSYSSTADLLANWASVSSHLVWDATAGRYGGGCLRSDGFGSSVGASSPQNIASSNASTNFMGWSGWFKSPSPPASQSNLIIPFNSSNGVAGILYLNTNGTVQWYNGSVPVINGTKNIADGLWHFIEWKTKCTNVSFTGTFVVDNVQDWTVGGNAQVGGFSYFALYNVPGVINYWDDILVWEDDGVFPQGSDFPLGLLRAVTKRGTSDSAVSFATATGGGTHFNQVNSVAPQSTNNVSDPNTSGHQDLYGMAATGITPSSILGVGTTIYGSNPGGGTQNIRAACKNGGTTINGTTKVMPTAGPFGGNMQDFFAIDPATSARWANISAVDAATFGFNIP